MSLWFQLCYFDYEEFLREALASKVTNSFHFAGVKTDSRKRLDISRWTGFVGWEALV